MDHDKISEALGELRTHAKYQTQILEELKEEDRLLKKDVESLKHSRSRLRGVLVGLGLLGGGSAAGHTPMLEKFLQFIGQ